MNKYILLVLILIVSLSFKQNKSTEKITKQLSISEKIANAHGFEKWQQVSEIAFTFSGKRSWVWNPKTSDVTCIIDGDTIRYNTGHVDTSLIKIDRGFINDKFWLLIPFQLV